MTDGEFVVVDDPGWKGSVSTRWSSFEDSGDDRIVLVDLVSSTVAEPVLVELQGIIVTDPETP
jgi:hypothetical protein